MVQGLHDAIFVVGLVLGAVSLGMLLGNPESRVPIMFGLGISALGAIAGAVLASAAVLYRRFR